MGVSTAEYRDWLVASGLAASTVRQRVRFAERRSQEWSSIAAMPQAEIAAWLSQYDGWTRRTYQNHLNSMYAFLVATGRLDRNPLTGIRPAKLPKLVAQPLSVDELGLVIGTAHGDLRTWLLLGYLAGMRCHEIAKVRGEDVTVERIRIAGKGGVVAFVETHPELWDLARSRYPRRGHWFPSPQVDRAHVSTSHIGNIVRAHFRALGIEDGAVHRLRHTYCTTLARNGVPAPVIQGLMRHGSLTTTQGYIATCGDERATAIAGLHVPRPRSHPGIEPSPVAGQEWPVSA